MSARKLDPDLMRKWFSGTAGAHSRQRILKISQDLETQFTLLLDTLILIQLVEVAGPELLAILEHGKVLEIFWLPGVNRASVYVSLTIAQRGPALHLFPESEHRGDKCPGVRVLSLRNPDNAGRQKLC